MENVTIELSKELIVSSCQKAVESILGGSSYSYDNPIKKAVENSLKNKQTEINMIVNKVITEVITSEEFKLKIQDIVSYSVLKDLDKLKK